MNRRKLVAAASQRLARKDRKPVFKRLSALLLMLVLIFTATAPFQIYAQGQSGYEGLQGDVNRKEAVQALENEVILEEEPASIVGVWRGLLNNNPDPDVWFIQFNEDKTYKFWVSGPNAAGSGYGNYVMSPDNELSLNNTVVLKFYGQYKSFYVTKKKVALENDRWSFEIESNDSKPMKLPVLFFSAQVPSLGLMSNDDGDNAFRSGDPEESVNLLKEHMTGLANTGVQSLQYNVAAGVLYYPTSVGSRYAWKLSEVNQTAIDCDDPPAWYLKCKETFGEDHCRYNDSWVRTCWAHNVFLEGYDPVRIAGEAFLAAGQASGQEKRFFLSYRISDDHFAPLPDKYPLTTKFWEENQSTLRIGASGEPPIPAALFANGLENMLNFEKKQVRNQAVAEIKEAMTRYSDIISGFEIDFTRAPYLFPKDRAQAQENLDAMTAMIAEVRRYMNLLQVQEGISRPLYLIVRVPPTLANAKWAGLDVPTWISQRLVDVVIPSHIMSLSQELNIEEFVSLASKSGTVVYGGAPLRTNYGWRLDTAFPQNTYLKTSYNAMPYPPAFYGAALNFYEAGAEGIQLYNMMAPSWVGEEWVNLFVKKLAHPKAQVIEAITNAAHEYFVTLPTLTSWEGNHEPVQQLPVYMDGGLQQFQTFELNVQTDPSTQQNPPVFRIGLYQQLDDSKRFSFKINGNTSVDQEPVSNYLIKTSKVNDASKVSNRAVTTRTAPAAYLQFEINPALLHKGLNQISISLEEPTSILDLRLAFPNACGPGESAWEMLLVCLPVTAIQLEGKAQLTAGETVTTVTYADYTDGSRVKLTEGVAFASSNPLVATIDLTGTVKALAAGTTVITAKYGGKTAKFELTVKAADVEQPEQPTLERIELTGLDSTLTVGETLKAEVYASYSDNSKVLVAEGITFTSSNPSVATIDPAGTVKALTAGTTVTTATYGGKIAEFSLEVRASGNNGGTPTTEPTPTPTPTSTPTSTPTPTPTSQPTMQPTPKPAQPGQIEVSVKELNQKAREGSVIFETEDAFERISLPGNAAEILQETAVQINAANLSLTIPASVLRQLGALIPAELQESGTVELEAIQVSGAVADQLIAKAARQSFASITPKGNLLEFKLSIKTKDGKTKTLSSFNTPIRISLKAAADTDRTIAGIYNVAENGELEYVGGTWQDAELTAEIPHLSKYGILEYDKSFADLNVGHWAAAAVRQLAANHLVDGVSDSEFAPERHVTRAEFTSMLVRILGLQAGGSTPYADVAVSKWYAQAIAAAAKAGIVNGVDAAHFAPDAEIKRQEMAAMIVRSYEYATGTKVSIGQSEQAFTDMEASPEWAKQAVEAAYKLGLVNGRREGQFQPEQQTTRAESAKVIVELLTVVTDQK